MNCTLKKLRTPVGEVFLAATDKALVALVWEEAELARLGVPAEAGLSAPSKASASWLAETEKQLGEYFLGRRDRFDLPLDLRGTEFQRQVWGQLAKIPYGATWSYRDLAKNVGNPGAVRAVGTANGRNPISIIIPCHRVVRATGELGGYAGGPQNKAFLLDLEKQAPEKQG